MKLIEDDEVLELNPTVGLEMESEMSKQHNKQTQQQQKQTMKTEDTKTQENKFRIFLSRKNATFPTKGSEEAACYDVYAAFNDKELIRQYGEDGKSITAWAKDKTIAIHPKARALIPTGIRFDIPKGYAIEVYSRSGYSFKEGVMLVNSTGIIDSDYKGELYLSLYNSNSQRVFIESGARIAQFKIVKLEDVQFEEVKDYDEKSSVRSTGGFGSTGIY